MANETEPHVCPYPDCGGRRLSSKRYLAAHIQRVHENPNRACSLCHKTFSGRPGLELHIRSVHTGERPFTCTHPGCLKAFTCEKHIRAHAKTHLQIDKPFSCTHCDKSFANRTHLAIHNRIHTGEKPFACSHCENCFRTKQHLGNHLWSHRHTAERPFKCTFCPYSSSSACNLAHHVRSHTGEKPFKCDECGTTFVAKGNLTKHTAMLHMPTNTSRRRHECSVCNKMYASANYLKIHQRTQHLRHLDNLQVEISCSICGEVFLDQISFRQHNKIHVRVKPTFACEFCGKNFGEKQNFLEHLRRHTGEKPFTCRGVQGCGKRFVTSSKLRRHEKTHQIRRERPYKCTWCYKSYHDKWQLRTHSTICKSRPDPEYRKQVLEKVQRNKETGEHPFFCEACATPLSSKGHLKRHMSIHDLDPERQFECEQCGRRYCDSYELQRHLKKSHICGLRQQKTSEGDGHLLLNAPTTTTVTSVTQEATKFRELIVVLPHLNYSKQK